MADAMTGSHQESGGRLLFVLVPKCARQTAFTDRSGEKVQGEEAVRKRKYVLCCSAGVREEEGKGGEIPETQCQG